jgi:hypothetical protein
MTPRLIRFTIIVALVLTIGAIPPLLARAVPRPSLPAAGAAAGTRPPVLQRVPDSVMTNVIARTPFRARRVPSSVAYDPDRGSEEQTPVPQRPPRPALALTGIVWDEEPEAVIEGLPGTNGPRVVRRNDVVGELKVRRIGSEQVVITGLDTTWTLRVREPWR